MINLQKEIDAFYAGYQGANDLRTTTEKANDFNHGELVSSAAPIDWNVKTREDFRGFPELNQNFTYKCVAFTTAKLALINFWLKTKEMLRFSPNSIYHYRSNKPDVGMVGDDAFKIWKDRGISLEAIAKSDQIVDGDPFEVPLMAQEIAKGFKLGYYITINNGDFDRIASTIQVTGKGIMVWFYFTAREWELEFPQILDNLTSPNDTNALRHSVTAVDYGILDGKEVIKIEDSAHFGNRSVRYITREFFQARNFLAKYPMNFNFENPEVKPNRHTFTKNLDFGQTDNDIKALQDILKFEGLFPTNTASTGYYGAITAKAVMGWQKKHAVASVEEIDALQGRKVGIKTREVLNSIYGE